MSTIRIGWGHEDITPQVPLALAGWAVDRFAEEVRDPLTVTALALESDGESAVMVSCDLINIRKELVADVRDSVRESASDLDVEKVFLFGTHTHNAPYQSEQHLHSPWGVVRNYRPEGDDRYLRPADYHDLLVDRISRAVAHAWSSRTEGGVSHGFDHAAIGHNRRVVFSDGTVQMYGRCATTNFRTLEGPEDTGVEVLYLWDREGALTGVAVNVACPSQTVESRRYVSADYWSETRARLRERFGESLNVLPMIGAAGDVAPHDVMRRMHNKPRDFEAELKRTADHIAFVVDRVHRRAKDEIRYDVDVRHSVETLRLPVRRVTKQDAEAARAGYDEWKKKLGGELVDHYDELDGKQRFAVANILFTLHHAEQQEREPLYPMELHAVRIGDVAVTTNPFELYTDYGLRMKARSPAKQTLNVQLSCDIAGYLPTQKAVDAGGYGAWIFNGRIGPEGGDLLVDHTVAALQELWNDE
jgi:hypothetical protein